MRLFTRQVAHRDPPPSPAKLPPADVAPPEERPKGCGWFDSSHELQTGLWVTEHVQTEAVVHLVPLSWWLAWELAAAKPLTAHGAATSTQAEARAR